MVSQTSYPSTFNAPFYARFSEIPPSKAYYGPCRRPFCSNLKVVGVFFVAT